MSTHMETLLISFVKELSNSDSTKTIFTQILDQLNVSNSYHSNLRSVANYIFSLSIFRLFRLSVGKLHLASKKAKRSSGRVRSKSEYQAGTAKINTLRKLIVEGLDSLEAECGTLEDQLAQVNISSTQSARLDTGEKVMKTTSPPLSPDLSSDSGFKTDDGNRSASEEYFNSQPETLTDSCLDLDEDSDTTIFNEDNSESDYESAKKNYERFDISFSEDGECQISDASVSGLGLRGLAEAEENVQPQQQMTGLSPAIVELEKYFQAPRRWDIFDIDEEDEENLTPMTNSPIAVCTRVTPLDDLINSRDRTFDEASSTFSSEIASFKGTAEMPNDEETFKTDPVEIFKALNLNAEILSFPPVYEVLTSDVRKTFSVEGSKKFLSALDSLQTNYKSKITIIAEKLQQHEEDRPDFLSKEMKVRMLLIKTAYPEDHPNFSELWMDLFCRLFEPKLTPHQVKVADMWCRKRTQLENQLLACKLDTERELDKLQKSINKVARWMMEKSKEKEAKRDELEGQKHLCARLHDELAMMREYKRLREKERERHQMMIKVQREKLKLEKVEAERSRRETDRDKILQWKRNRMDIQNMAKLQLEEELRMVLRQRQVKTGEDKHRIRFRKVQFDKKIDERNERGRERMRAVQERNMRLDLLRHAARRRLGVHVITADRSRVSRMTKSSENRLLRQENTSILAPLFSINSWTEDDLSRDQRLVIEQELRERGLLSNEYALKQILNTAPPTLPRRDVTSTISVGKNKSLV